MVLSGKRALSIPGSPFAPGFSDRADEMYKHGRDLYRVIKQHGPGVVVPSREEAEAWLRDVKEECLDRLDECMKDKAKEAAEALNDFQKKPWDDKKYIAGGWAFGAVEAVIETAALPGAGIAAGGAAKAGERVVVKGAVKQVEKEAVAAAEHAGEAAAKKAAKEAAEAEAKRIAEARAAERGTGRGANHLKPDPDAQGSHSTFKTDTQGNVTGHAEWQPNPRNPSGMNQVKRVDTQYANPHTHHNNATGQQVPTPHVHEKSTTGGVRAARPDELPK